MSGTGSRRRTRPHRTRPRRAHFRGRSALVGLLAGASLIAANAPDASAISLTTNADYQCLTSAPSFGGTLVRTPQTLQVAIDAPLGAAPGSTVPVIVSVLDVTPYRRPVSPPVALADVTVKMQASVDIVQNTLNSAPAQSVPSTSSVSGLDTVGVLTSNQAANTPWVTVPSVTMNVIVPNTPGERLWLRPGQLDFLFTATGGANPNAAVTGVTSCVPVDPTQVLPGSTVTSPTYGIYARYNAPSPMRIGVTGSPAPPPTDQCTAQSGDQTGGTGCPTGQGVNALITAGNLSQQARQTGSNPNSVTVEMGSVTVASTTQFLTAPLNTVTVTDLRGGMFGWTLSAAMQGPFTNPSADTISPGQLHISGLSCTGDANSAPSTVGTSGAFSGPVTLCLVAPGALGPNQSGSGIYDVAGTLTLDVPALQHNGQYQGLLMVTLI